MGNWQKQHQMGRQMAYAFDTLGYAKRLRDAGLPENEAEAHAEAAREFIMTELVTKSDLDIWGRGMEAAMENLELRLTASIEAVRHELTEAISVVRQEFTASLASNRQEQTTSAASIRQEQAASTASIRQEQAAATASIREE